MPVRFKTFPDLRAEFVAFFTSGATAVKDTRDIAVLGTIASAVAALQSGGWNGLADLRAAFYVQKSEGDDLDRRIADVGMVRYQGSLSTGKVLGIRASGTESIPAGTLLVDANNVVLRVLNTTIVSAPRTAIDVTAVEVGRAGNLPAGRTLTAIAGGLTTTFRVGAGVDGSGSPVTDLAGGSDRESDTAVKKRYPAFIKSLRGTTIEAVRNALIATSGVTNLVLENAKPVPGMVTIRVSPDGPGNTISQVLRDAITSSMVTAGPSGFGWELYPLIPRVVPVTIKVYTSNDGASPATIKNAIIAAVSALTDDPIPGDSLYLSDIVVAARGAATDVYNIEILSPATDVVAAEGDIIVVGVVDVTVVYT